MEKKIPLQIFKSICDKNNLEYFTADEISNYYKNGIEKSAGMTASEKEEFVGDIISLRKCICIDDDGKDVTMYFKESDVFFDEFEKARAGVYADTSKNRRLHRVGQKYGAEGKPDEEGGEKRSKNEVRTERLKKYQESLKKIKEKLNTEGLSDEARKVGEELKAKMESKIEKLSKKIKPSKTEEKAEKKNEEKPEVKSEEKPVEEKNEPDEKPSEEKDKTILADSLKNDFSSLMDILSPFIEEVEVSKVSGEDTEVVATYPVSEWKKGVHEVGSGFYGKSDLLELSTKVDSGIDMIQLRRYTSNGYGAMYQNQPVGHVIVEVLTNDWKDYDMKSEKDRKALADFLNGLKKSEAKKEGSKVEKFDVSKAQITYPNSEKTAKEAAAEFTKILGDMGFDVSKGAPWLGWNAYQPVAPGVMLHYGSSEKWDEFYFMASITDTNTKKQYWYKDGDEKDVVSNGERLSLKEFLSKIQELRKKE